MALIDIHVNDRDNDSSTQQACSINPSSPVSAERTGNRTYVGHNERGATVQIGMGPGQFSPGDLLKLALVTCQGMCINDSFADVLGDDFSQVMKISSVKNEVEDRFDSFGMEFLQDLTSLSAVQRSAVQSRALAAVALRCTVGHTLTHGSTYDTVFVSDTAKS